MRTTVGWGVAGSVSLIVGSAHALPPPNVCLPQHEYFPATYVNVVGGDAVLLPVTPDLAGALMGSVGLTHSHVALTFDSTGSNFAESQYNGQAPQSGSAAGNAHECSRVLSSQGLQNLSPGTTGGATSDPSDVVAGALVFPQVGRAGCTSGADAYHFNSFIDHYENGVLNPNYGGSCEKYVVDYCGVPVQPSDKFFLTGANATGPAGLAISSIEGIASMMSYGIDQLWIASYDAALGKTSDLPDIDYLVCGGVDSTILAQRAANQVVNEVLLKWDQTEPTDSLGADTDAEYAHITLPNGQPYAEMLGGAAQNWAVYNPSQAPSYQPPPSNGQASYPGTCYNSGQSNTQADPFCPSWSNYGAGVKMNVPDNIVTMAKRLNIAPISVAVTAAYYKTILPPPDCQNGL